MTHERDMLKKDCKRISLERDGAYKHLSLTTAAAAHAASQVVSHGPKPSSQQPTSNQPSASMDHESSQPGHSSQKSGHQLMALPPHHHHRTASDTGTAAPSPSSINSSIQKTGRTVIIFRFYSVQ